MNAPRDIDWRDLVHTVLLTDAERSVIFEMRTRRAGGGPLVLRWEPTPCPTCDGEGTVLRNVVCHGCRGSGFVGDTVTMEGLEQVGVLGGTISNTHPTRWTYRLVPIAPAAEEPT